MFITSHVDWRSHGISARQNVLVRGGCPHLASAALHFSATTEVHDRFWINRYSPSHRRAQNASAALRIFVRHPKISLQHGVFPGQLSRT